MARCRCDRGAEITKPLKTRISQEAHKSVRRRLLRSGPTGLRLGGRLGYAARDQIIGGLSAGVSASYDF